MRRPYNAHILSQIPRNVSPALRYGSILFDLSIRSRHRRIRDRAQSVISSGAGLLRSVPELGEGWRNGRGILLYEILILFVAWTGGIG